MAQTLEDRVRLLVGSLMLENLQLQTKLEQLEEATRPAHHVSAFPAAAPPKQPAAGS